MTNSLAKVLTVQLVGAVDEMNNHHHSVPDQLQGTNVVVMIASTTK